MNNIMKIALVILTVAYCVSPMDFFPGPIDDILLIVLSIAAQKRIGQNNEYC